MSDNAHRARAGARTRIAAVAGAIALLVALTALVVVQTSGDDPPARAQDLTGSTPASEDALDDVVVESAGTPRGTSKRERVAARQRKARSRVEPVVTERSEALGELVALAEEKAARDARAARRAARKAEKTQEKTVQAVSGAPFSVKVGSFNVLGSQHTAPGGQNPGYPPASVRSAATVNAMARHQVDILGTQELQADQLRYLQARTGMAAYPGFQWGEAETDNSILYDSGRFEFVSGDRFTITFMGRPRPQPILRLRERSTGREFYVVNTHPSAGGGSYEAQRRQGHAILVSVVNGLQQSGLPVLVTGDMNDREIFYCNVVPAAGLTASNGGSYSSGCRPPPEPVAVDWVVGSGVAWSGYWRDTSTVTNKVSNHFFISAMASFG